MIPLRYVRLRLPLSCAPQLYSVGKGYVPNIYHHLGRVVRACICSLLLCLGWTGVARVVIPIAAHMRFGVSHCEDPVKLTVHAVST